MRRELITATVGLLLALACTRPLVPATSGEKHTGPSAPSDFVASADFLSGAQAHIEAREYWASEVGDGLQAPNRRHDLRSWFDASGVRVDARTGSAPSLLGLRLTSVGRGDRLADVETGELRHRENRVEIVREELGLVEWFVNSTAGLEQGFTLNAPPGGNATSDGDLLLELAVSGAKASRRDDSALILTTGAGRRLDYGGLAVLDARGRELAARFEVASDDRIRIRVDDAGAIYPIVIDPLLAEFNQPDATLQSNQDGGYLGWSVASAGDVNGDGFDDVIVSAWWLDIGQTDEGAAFVFHGGPNGVGAGSPANADSVIQSNQANARLGDEVASAGDVNGDGFDDVLVGDAGFDGPEVDEGAAFVFLGSAAGIVGSSPATADARLESNQTGAAMGFSVASAGDVNGDGYSDVAVGAWGFDGPEIDEGAAFVFLGSATGIPSGNPTTAHAQIESNQAGAQLGVAVSSAGDIDADGYSDLLVGAPVYSDGQASEGTALVFRGSAAGIADGSPATAHARLQSDQANAFFGYNLSSAGDVNGDGYSDVIVGAYLYDAGQTDEGAAFVFHGSATGMTDGSPVTADAQVEANEAGARLGRDVASAGDVNGDGYADVVIGAYLSDDGETDSGLAGVLYGSAAGIPGGQLQVFSSDRSFLIPIQPFATMGISVAGAGDVNGDGYDDVIAGAYLFDSGNVDEGQAFVYHGSARGLGQTSLSVGSAVRLESDQIAAEMGQSVASAGDVNGDGYSDVIIGAPSFDNGQVDEGAAFVFLGSAAGAPTTAHAQLESNQANARLGFSVASAGDVDGDGYADVIVGAWRFDGPEIDEGAAFVFTGSATGIPDGDPTTAHARLESNQANALLGFSVASAGDVDGDGYADVIVGSPAYDSGQADEGAAFVFLGSATGIPHGNPTTAHARLESNQAGAQLGISVASAGDVDGDGYADLIAGSYAYDSGQADEGAAFVFLGSATGIPNGDPTTAHAQLESNQAGAGMGLSVSSAGDVDGDGYSDVIVGSSLYDFGQANEGAAFVFLGSPQGVLDGSPANANAQLESNQANAAFGISVAAAGDVDGDGYADVIVGSILYDSGQANEGGVFIFPGSAGGIVDGSPITARTEIYSDQIEAELGESVASAGDVNGDGYSDVIVGARRFDAGQAGEGAAFVFLGNSKGRPSLPRQRRSDGIGTPVVPGTGAFASDRFRIELHARSPRGRERAKLEVEVCPAGVAFGDPGCIEQMSSAWVDLGTSGAVLIHEVTGLDANRTHSWHARIHYAAYTSTLPGIVPSVRPGPWFRQQGLSNVGDIRTVPEPSVALALALGAGGLVALSRARRRARTGPGRASPPNVPFRGTRDTGSGLRIRLCVCTPPTSGRFERGPT